MGIIQRHDLTILRIHHEHGYILSVLFLQFCLYLFLNNLLHICINTCHKVIAVSCRLDAIHADISADGKSKQMARKFFVRIDTYIPLFVIDSNDIGSFIGFAVFLKFLYFLVLNALLCHYIVRFFICQKSCDLLICKSEKFLQR